MMVCHQVVATLDVVISDLRRDKVILKCCRGLFVGTRGASFWCKTIWGGRGRSMASDALDQKEKSKQENKMKAGFGNLHTVT